MFCRCLVLCILFLKCYFFSFGQKVEFEHISNNEGLVSSEVTCILKDYKGYMWFGTFNGLSKFNGYEFTNYINEPLDKKSLNDNYIRCLMETKNKQLFVGFHYLGMCIYNRDTDDFTRFLHDPNNSNSLAHNCILTIYEDSKSNVWVGTRGGLDKFDIKTKTFKHFKPFPNNNNIVSSIFDDGSGNLWLCGQSNEICKFNTSDGTFTYIKYTEKLNDIKSFYKGAVMLMDTKKNLWIGNETFGLFRFNIRTGNYETFCKENQILNSNNITSLHEDRDSNIWIGTDGGGLYKYTYKNNLFENFKNDPGDPLSISSNAVYSIYESDPGIIWFGVYASGLNIYKKNKRKFTNHTATGVFGRSISQKSILGIAQAEKNKIWLGTDGGGLNLFDPEKNNFTYYSTKNSGINSDIIKAIVKDEKGNIWTGSFGGGLGKINFANGTSRIFSGHANQEEDLLRNEHVWALTETSDKKIWIGLLGYGLQIFDPATGQLGYEPFDTTAVNKAVCNIFTIYEDSKKRVWIGTQGAGLGYIDPVTKKVIKVFLKSKDNQPLDNNEIGCIFEDSKHTIWVGTGRSGLIKIEDLEKKKFISYTTKEGLSSNKVKSIVEDGSNNLWIGTHNGISKFNIASNQIINFDKEDGLASKEYNYNSALKSADGKIYFGGTEGFDVFDPDSMFFNQKKPRVVLSELKIFNQTIHAQQSYNNHVYLEKDISLINTLTLEHKDYVFSLEFAAMDFISPKKNKYAYRLKGFHDKWTYVNFDKRMATYTNLDAGEYLFQVIACNNDGKWNNDGASLKIVVLPPWWETWWFRTAAAIAIFLGIAGFYYLRLRSVRERNKFLEDEVKKRTVELNNINNALQTTNQEILIQKQEILHQKNELENKTTELEVVNKTKDKFFSIVAHDLKGPVNALTFLTSMLKKEWETYSLEMQRDYLNHVDKASHQVKDLVISLLEWARTQTRQSTIEPEPILVSKVLEETLNHLSQQASQKDLIITCKSSHDIAVFADYNMTTAIVRNVVSNSIKYTPKGGSICLSTIKTAENYIRISVHDSGIGMSPDLLEKLFTLEKGPSRKGTDKETGTGLGLVICHEFAAINKGRIWAESVKNEGSIFHIELPMAMSA